MNKRGNYFRNIGALLILAILVLGIYFTWFYYPSCGNIGCYKSHQAECKKSIFIYDKEDRLIEYKILGSSGNNCEIEVKILEVKKGEISNSQLVGKSMSCLIPKKSLIDAESDLKKCSGELKEELQDLIIKKMYKYIVDNIKQVSEEISKLGTEE